MPADDGFRLNDDQHFRPSRPEALEHHPEQSVQPVQSRTRMFAFEYGDLLSQGEDFESQIAATSKERPEREDQRKDGFHRHETYTFNTP
jgi:hypothetical protein